MYKSMPDLLITIEDTIAKATRWGVSQYLAMDAYCVPQEDTVQGLCAGDALKEADRGALGNGDGAHRGDDGTPSAARGSV
jgi:hypothetical protein